ncbi:MAG: DUF5684 domain-containing protein [Saprospiraceae bacterium]
MEWCKLIGRKPQYALWLLFPIVNIFIYSGMVIDLLRSFGKYSFTQAFMAVVFAPVPFFMAGRDPNATYQGPILEKEREYHRLHHEAIEKKDKLALSKLKAQYPFLQKSPTRSGLKPSFLPCLLRPLSGMFLIEAYVIPTSSMEGTLKVGDFLFVSKAHYGIRTPKTVLQFPLIHNRLPLDLGESYLTEPSLPYYRLPALEKVDRNDPVVFNWPAGDSIILTPQRSWDLHRVRMQNGRKAPPGSM